MIVELERMFGVMHDGTKAEIGQWRCLVNGHLAGYLNHDVGSRLCLIATFSDKEREYIAKECEKLREPPGPVGIPMPFFSTTVIEEALNAGINEDEEEEVTE